MLARLFNQALEVSQSAELGMDRFVATLFRADGPGAAGVVLIRMQSAILALAMTPPDRMNRRQIENVEAQRCDIRQPPFAIFESAVPVRCRRARAREHFIPGAEAGAFAVDDDGQRLGITGDE